MDFRLLVASVLVAAVSALTGGCATDPFDWKDTRPVPSQMVRRHQILGTRRVLRGSYADAYRAAARTFDVTAYYSVVRDQGAIYADDFHGMSSVAVFLRPGGAEDRVQLEALYLHENYLSFAPGRRRQAETAFLDDIEQTLAAMKGEAAPGDDAVAAAALARSRLDSDRLSARGSSVSAVDSPAGLPTRRRPRDWALIVGAERHQWLGDADYAERDAAAFHRYAETALGVPRSHAVHLSGAQATRAEVLSAVRDLRARSGPDSRVWFYFAGHGGCDESSGIPYLVTWDANPRYWTKTSLPLAELYRAFDAVEAEQVVVILDASFSGPGGRTWNELDHPPAFPETRPKPSGGVRVSVLYATQPGENAAVLDEQGHGLMTYALLRGLRGEAGGRRGLTVQELGRFVYRTVRAQAKELGRVQNPRLDEGLSDAIVW